MDERQATRQEATRVPVPHSPASAQVALDRAEAGIVGLENAVALLDNCITHRRTAGIDPNTGYWVGKVIEQARTVAADRRLSLGAARGFLAADPEKCVAMLQIAGLDSGFWTTLCDTVVEWLELRGYITFGKLRAVGGHRGD
jgi:hypothetical protein